MDLHLMKDAWKKINMQDALYVQSVKSCKWYDHNDINYNNDKKRITFDDDNNDDTYDDNDTRLLLIWF